jgi:hypothetical protein
MSQDPAAASRAAGHARVPGSARRLILTVPQILIGYFGLKCKTAPCKSPHLCDNTAGAERSEEVTVSPAPAVSASFSTAVVPVGASQPLNVSRFTPGQKPGNVALCLSGGGSRALTAGMGQLNALQTVPYAPNMSLLSQAKALSTVSGGSWLEVPFAYLPPSVSDVNYLGGPYVQPASLTPARLGSLPSGCIAANITSDFTLLDMVVQAVLLYWEGVPAGLVVQLRPKRVERDPEREPLSPTGAGQPGERSTPAVPGLQYGDVRDRERPISAGSRAGDQLHDGNR